MANRVISIEQGVATVDVSTPKYPAAVTIVEHLDLPLMLDGRGRWGAVRVKQTSAKLYVSRQVGGRKNRQSQFLHRVILGLTDSKVFVDHRNGNTMNNLRSNLREATNKQNSQNGAPHRDGTSIFRGVSWDADRAKWTAGIGIDGKRISLGRFTSDVAAARAYDAAALKEFGKFAFLNFPRE